MESLQCSFDFLCFSLLVEMIRKIPDKATTFKKIMFSMVHFVFYNFSGLSYSFNLDNITVGNDWIAGFLHRNPEVRIRKSEAISLNKVTAFHPNEINLFFDLLEEVRTKYKFKEHNIYRVSGGKITQRG